MITKIMRILPNTIWFLHEIHNTNWLNNIFELLKQNYSMVSAADLENYYYNAGYLKNTCHITLDDGDISFYNNTLPLVKKHNIPVSIYVSPLMAKEKKNFWFQEIRGYNEEKLIEAIKKVIGTKDEEIQPFSPKAYLKSLKLEVIREIISLYQKETNTPPKPPMNMTINQLKEVNSCGLVEIGAHTLNHPILANEDDGTAENEIIKSIDNLADILNSEIKYFAYPNGRHGLDFGEREINILRNKGIKLAFSTNRKKMSLTNNPLSIPRSGSPLISDAGNNQFLSYSKCIVQGRILQKN